MIKFICIISALIIMQFSSIDVYATSCNSRNIKSPIPYDLGTGWNLTWFKSKSNGVNISITHNKIKQKLELQSNKNSYVWIDHVPIYLNRGFYEINFKSDNLECNNAYIELIKMKSNKEGKFDNKITSKFEYKDGQYNSKFNILKDYKYIIRIKLEKINSNISQIHDLNFIKNEILYDNVFEFYPYINDVVFDVKDDITLGLRVFPSKKILNHRYKFSVKNINGKEVCRGEFKPASNTLFYEKEIKFNLKDYGYYIVTYIINKFESDEEICIQKSFSVLPLEDCEFMGLHAYPVSRSKEYLILGRKLGFVHYRDHDMGKFTRWNIVQNGNSGTYSPENPPTFNWKNHTDVDYIVNKLGYNYLGVLFDTPKWAIDSLSDIKNQKSKIPVLKSWRNYVHSVVKYYSFDNDLIKEWEIWNEGKGIAGENLDRSDVYKKLSSIAFEELLKLNNKYQKFDVDFVGMAGFHASWFWKDILINCPYEVVSSHVRGEKFKDSYYNIDGRPFRDAWLQQADKIIKKFPTVRKHYDTETGIWSQIYPVYEYIFPLSENENNKSVLSDRTAHYYYDINNYQNRLPLLPLEAAGIFVRQIIAHKSNNISRCYMYYLTNRDFVSDLYTEQMLEYDGTLMPYTHAFVFVSKILNEYKHIERKWINDDVVCEIFKNDDKTIICIWNDDSKVSKYRLKKNIIGYDFMGSSINVLKDDFLVIDKQPLFIILKDNSKIEDVILL